MCVHGGDAFPWPGATLLSPAAPSTGAPRNAPEKQGATFSVLTPRALRLRLEWPRGSACRTTGLAGTPDPDICGTRLHSGCAWVILGTSLVVRQPRWHEQVAGDGTLPAHRRFWSGLRKRRDGRRSRLGTVRPAPFWSLRFRAFQCIAPLV